ncbi:MAG: hypothetical protein AMS17_04540 [Spirochaetes bacterium DG_61]|nr:MAG: hypothetical protein AMS17_04540 [Spirochaetes bacterium DG_61]
MNIAVFSDSKQIASSFTHLQEKKGFTLSVYPCDTLKSRIKELEKSVFIYVDLSLYEEGERVRTLRYLAGRKGLHYGIVDPKGAIKDVALLFFSGASDYIGKELLREGMSTARMKKALLTVQKQLVETKDRALTPVSSALIPSGKSWKEIKSGKEYTFSLMFIELDHHGEFRKNLGEDLINAVTSSFKKLVEKRMVMDGGRIWIWNDFGGLILFPFDGVECAAVLSCFRLMLNRKLIHAEELPCRVPFSFRIVLHIGNTVYRQKGKTGTLVSDSINSIYHLGKKFARPGNFYITKEVFRYIPEKLKPYFLSAGEYEGFAVLRMKLPL